jgi:hypothetical protein
MIEMNMTAAEALALVDYINGHATDEQLAMVRGVYKRLITGMVAL